MIKFKITHKATKEEITVGANDKESALQIVCSENAFVPSLKNYCGWWERTQVDITEA
jgi:hypothetical protein